MNESSDVNLDRAVVVALGSNMPGAYADSPALLEAALAAFPAEGLAVLARSGWWRSAAWPDPAGPAYTNGVAIVETQLSPREMLAALHRIERSFGRMRGDLNAARTLDLDLIAHGRLTSDAPDLILPHPRAHERLFVMGPLAETVAGWRHPVSGATAVQLAAAASVGCDAAPIA